MEWMTLGIVIIFIGFILIFAGMLCMFYQAWEEAAKQHPPPQNSEEHGVRGGGIVMIGPFPIIFGTDATSVKVLMILAIVLMLIAFALILLGSRILY